MNIRVDLNTSIKDGLEVVFRSPVDCSQITGLIVYYDGGSKEFAFADAHGNNVGDIDHLFAENVVVKVILDVTNGMAFVQNADTNTYLEEQFAKCVKTVNGTAPDKNGNVVLQLPSGGGADGLSFAETTGTLYLMSRGQIIEGSGVQLPASGGPTNNAVLTLENTSGWSSKTISNVHPSCIISINWSSVDGGVSTGTGTVTVKVENELRYSANIKQGAYTINVIDYLRLGENRVDLTITDFRGNSKSILFIVSMYDPEALISKKLVEKTLTGDYTNDRLTKVGLGAFAGLNLGKLSLPNVTGDIAHAFTSLTADELNLPSLEATSYWMVNNSTIGVLRLPNVTSISTREDFRAKKVERIVFNRLEDFVCTQNIPAFYFPVVTLDFHKLKAFNNSIESGTLSNIIIRTPDEVCTLQSVPGSTTVKLYVPAALVEQYKVATNWSSMADRIFAIEDNLDFCGGE
jgi:hypothetical protein